MKTLHQTFYVLLFVLLAGSAVEFAYLALTNDHFFWEWYSKIYLLLLLISTWYIFVVLFIGDLKPRKYSAYKGGMIAVIVPCYNEHPVLLRRSIESVVEAHGNKKIFLIDDGSTNISLGEYGRMQDRYGAMLHITYFDTNRGKRHALHHAVTKLIGDCEFVVTIDSDTILDENALVRIVEPLQDEKIGASTGDVLILNQNQNWMTKMVATYYWIGLNIYKKAQSIMGFVVCCSGCLAAYRAPLLREIIDEFVNQEFFGERCTHSEDRHLTNLILKRGYNVVYTERAICYTETPSTVRGFLKQQQRWKRGFIRESTYTLTYAWKTRKILFLEVLLWDLTAPFVALGLRIAVVITILTNPLFFLVFILPSWILFMMIRYIFVFIYARDKIAGLFLYMIFYEVFLYWLNIYALFTVKNKSWVTR